MSREEALAKLAEEMKNHFPNKSYGCECIRRELEPRNVSVAHLEPMELWHEHVAKIAFDHVKGF